MPLFKPAWQSKHVEKAMRAVERESDQRKLIIIAQNAQYPSVGLRAVEKISDEAMLYKLITDWPNRSYLRGRIQKAAVKRISNLTYLLDIALHDVHSYTGVLAADKLSGKPDLMRIASHSKCISARVHAMSKLQDEQAFLLELAKNDDERPVRRVAIGQLEEQAAIESIARNDPDKDIRIEAIKHLTSQQVLAELAVQEPDLDIAAAAVVQITDESVLRDIAKNSKRIFPEFTKAHNKLNRIRRVMQGKCPDTRDGKHAWVTLDVSYKTDPPVHRMKCKMCGAEWNREIPMD